MGMLMLTLCETVSLLLCSYNHTGMLMPTLCDYLFFLLLCSYDHMESLSNLLFLTLMAVVIPMIITYTAYGKIAATMWRSRQRVASYQQRKSTNNNTVTIFIMSSLFTLFWLPYSITAILENVGAIDIGWTTMAEWFGMSSSCINWLIWGLSSRKYKAASKLVLCCERGRLWALQRSGVSSITIR